jgi:hypothetical protein
MGLRTGQQSSSDYSPNDPEIQYHQKRINDLNNQATQLNNAANLSQGQSPGDVDGSSFSDNSSSSGLGAAAAKGFANAQGSGFGSGVIGAGASMLPVNAAAGAGTMGAGLLISGLQSHAEQEKQHEINLANEAMQRKQSELSAINQLMKISSGLSVGA